MGIARFRSCAISAPDTLLGTRELESRALDQLLRERAGPGQHRRATLRARLAMRLERELLRKQLVELEARPRRMRARIERFLRELGHARRRRVQEAHGIVELPQLAALHGFVGQRVGRQRRIACDRSGDELAQRVLRKPGSRRIDRREPVGQRRAFGNCFPLRMHDLKTEVAGAHVAEHAHALAGLQRLLLTGIEREEAQHELRFAIVRVGNERHELAPRPVLDLGTHDHTLGLHEQPRLHGGQRHEARVVLVAQRKMEDDVGVARDAEACELVGKTAARPRGLYCPFVWSNVSRHPVAGSRPAPGSTAVPSISIIAPRGNAATWYVARAG
jgi:hypothetical protein